MYEGPWPAMPSGGLASFEPAHMAGHRADGLLTAFVVDAVVSG